MGFQVLLIFILLFKNIISYKQCIEHNNKTYENYIESSSSPIAFHSSSNLKMLYLKVDYMSPFNAMCVL